MINDDKKVTAELIHYREDNDEEGHHHGNENKIYKRRGRYGAYRITKGFSVIRDFPTYLHYYYIEFFNVSLLLLLRLNLIN